MLCVMAGDNMQYFAHTNCEIRDLWGSLSTGVDKLPQRSIVYLRQSVFCESSKTRFILRSGMIHGDTATTRRGQEM